MTTPNTISNLKIDPTLIGFLNTDDKGNFFTVIGYNKKSKTLVGQLVNGLTLTRESVTFDTSVVDGVNTGAKVYIDTPTGSVSSVEGVYPKNVNTSDKRSGCMKRQNYSKEL